MGLLQTELDETRTDTELCALVLSGTENAYRVIYDRYRDRIHRLAYSYTSDADDSEDVTQQVFIRAYRSMGVFRGQSRLYTWLYQIAINCCKDWVKQAHHTRCDRRDELWWSDRAMGDSLFTRPSRTESSVERREAADVLRTALDGLKPAFRSPLVLREVEGMTYREISRALNCTEGTVKSRISRARHQLKTELISLGYAV